MFLLSVVAVGCGRLVLTGLQRRSAFCLLGDNPRGSAIRIQVWLNRSVDAMRFKQVDCKVVVNSAESEPIKIS